MSSRVRKLVRFFIVSLYLALLSYGLIEGVASGFYAALLKLAFG